MLNYNTLLSAYDDKLTLMQWLKKVEAALKDASAVSFNVNKRGNATITFSVVFEDGSELETGPIILQQGESVTGAAITNGHLILTLSNGDTLDAGGVGAVSYFSINAAQHLIVTYQDGSTQDLGAIFNGNVNIAGTLAVSGKISGGEIVEDMNGYSFTKMADTENIAFNYIYAGAVKNGNKLTMVVAVNVKKLSPNVDNMEFGIGTFTLPNDVMNKIYPTTIGGATYIIDEKGLKGISQAGYKITKDVLGYTEKVYGKIYMSAYIENMAQDDELYVRYEVTLLLSDNLAA